MASGLPIVSTAAGGVPNLLENGKEGFLVPPGDLQGLAKSMNALLKYRAGRESMGAAAASHARENFDVSHLVRSYEQVYEDLIPHPARRNAQSVSRRPVIPAEEGMASHQQ
jgi:glycosyltransferase involved in cell wall biosynthesis